MAHVDNAVLTTPCALQPQSSTVAPSVSLITDFTPVLKLFRQFSERGYANNTTQAPLSTSTWGPLETCAHILQTF